MAPAQTAAENKELIRRYTREVFDEGDVDAVDRYLAPDFYNHVTGRSGSEDFKRLATDLRDARGSANVIDMMVAEGDLVVALMTITCHPAQGAAGVRVHLPGQRAVLHRQARAYLSRRRRQDPRALGGARRSQHVAAARSPVIATARPMDC
jgi:predicted SnoaL-like aldol condensation-catalyzing enzyme